MKKPALLFSAFCAAILLSETVAAEPSPAASGPPRPGTIEAVRCLVRQDISAPCKTMFQGGARTAAAPWLFDSPDRDFRRGPLVSHTYWGRALDSNIFDARAMMGKPTKEMDIYDVKFDHEEYTFYISPADADGKIKAVTIRLLAPHDPRQLRGG